MPWFSLKAENLQPGQPAPDFNLPDQQGRHHALADYSGRWLVLYFYPKDDTPGCIREACQFRDHHQRLLEREAVVVGVSLDSTASHQAFGEKYRLPFPLLSDPDGEVARRYGALFKLGPLRFARRHSFIIDPKGRIARMYRKVEPDAHARQVLEELRALQAAWP